MENAKADHSDDLVIEAFTGLAPNYEQQMERELRQYWGLGYQDFIRRLVERIPLDQGARVLDVATGTAAIPLVLAGRSDLQARVVGLDITPAMLQQGQRRLARAAPRCSVQLVCASALEMPFGQGAFNVVICGLGMHHMDARRLLVEMRRVIQERGRLFMADVGASPFWRTPWGGFVLRLLLLQYGLLNRTARARAELAAFRNVRTVDEWHALLAETGFTGVHVDEVPARRPWYPTGLLIQATAGQAPA